MDNFVLIDKCEIKRFRLYLNVSNSDVLKKFGDINRIPKLLNKFVLVTEAVKNGVSNTTQFNYEGKCEFGDIYAIKVDEHRFYTLVIKGDSYRNLFICRYGKKQSNQNDKTLTTTIQSISKISINKIFKYE